MNRRTHARIAKPLALAVVMLALGTGVSLAVGVDQTELVSRAEGLNGAALDAGSHISLNASSADGRLVVFSTGATNVTSPQPAAPNGQLFVRDMQTGATENASLNSSQQPTLAISSDPSISGNGRFVVFRTNSTSFPGTTMSNYQIIRRDLLTDTAEVMSVTDSEVPGDALSYDPVINHDGTKVAFRSAAPNIIGVDSAQQIVVRDTTAGTTTIASRASGAAGALDDTGPLGSPGISADGTVVAFSTSGNNLVAGENESNSNIVARDLSTHQSTLISQSSGEVAADDGSHEPHVSADGQFISFDSTASNLEVAAVGGEPNVFVRDQVAGTTVLASRADGAAGAADDSNLQSHSLSDDGRFVAFESDAVGITGVDNGIGQIFVRDTAASTTRLVSRGAGPAGAPANELAENASITPDGSSVVFESVATNLASGGHPTGDNIFIRGLKPGSGATPAPLPLPIVPVEIKPNCSSVKLAKKKFRAVKKGRKGGGTKLKCKASKPAKLTVEFKRKVGKKLVKAGSVKFTLKAGVNTLKLTGQVRKKALKPGSYEIRLLLVDSAGKRDATPAKLRLTILR